MRLPFSIVTVRAAGGQPAAQPANAEPAAEAPLIAVTCVVDALDSPARTATICHTPVV
jgi:hypothetical protein